MVGKNHEKRLVLFDAHAIIHRAYHALPEFTTKTGEPTGGLYGLATMLMRAIAEFKPDYMAACYDLPGPTFRHKEYKDYKAGRAKADDALKQQLTRSRDVFAAFHIPIYESVGFEADDILGTIVAQTEKNKDLEILIVTGDMDTLQLVSGNRVRVYTLKKGINDTVVYDEEKVKERFGFAPSALPDYKGLRGDPSDNISGVAGIGEKTGCELIQKFGSIEEIYQLIAKNKEKLTDGRIKPRVVELLEKNEEEALFSKMLATIRRDAPISYSVPKTEWKDAFSPETAIALFDELEFKSLGGRIKSLKNTFAKEGEVSESTESEKRKEAHDVPPPSARALKEAAIGLWVLDSDKTTPSLEDILEYMNEDDFAAAYRKILAELKKENLLRVYEDIELPLVPIIEEIQKRGILVDVSYLKKLSREYHKKLSHEESEIYRYAEEVFNINSPKQLGVILFDKLGLIVKGLKKTEGGARSTRESELEKLREMHPIIGHILSYREIQKLLSTYIDNIPDMLGDDGRLHTTLKQDGTTTGRFSSADPNLQNIPVRDGLGAAIRDAFIAPRGRILMSFDYSQVEMRVLAMLSGDPALTEIFRSGSDIHTSVASRVFRVAPDAVTKEMRRRAKVINFGIIYGMGVNALKENLGSTRQEAQEFYDQYFVTFPRIAEYFAAVKKEAEKKGYTETLFGRRRQFPNLRSRIPYVKAMAERMAMNAPLQGTAADLIKIAMVRAEKAIHEAHLGKNCDLILQVHDELVYEVDDDKDVIERVKKLVINAMASAAEKTKSENIPLTVDVAKGKRWGSMKQGSI